MKDESYNENKGFTSLKSQDHSNKQIVPDSVKKEAIRLQTSIFGHGAAWSFLAGDRTRPSTRISIPAGGPSMKRTALVKGA